jgi:type I restriction enzyme R subunit
VQRPKPGPGQEGAGGEVELAKNDRCRDRGGVVRTERETPEEEDIDRGKAALTALFEEARTGDTPVMVKRVVDDIDEIVRAVRFDGWQATHAGEREVKKALRQTLFRYKLHQDADLFEKAYGYIREYY